MNNNHTPLKIVFLDRGGIPPRIKIPSPKASCEWINYEHTTQAQAAERSMGADILVVNKANVTARLLDACPSIKHVCVTATGYNVVDTQACTDRGIGVSNVPSYAATTVSEHVIGSALLLQRQILRYKHSVANGEWQRSNNFCLFGAPFQDLSGATIGLVGLGEIGLAVAEKAHALGMSVLFNSRSTKSHAFAQQVSLNELLAQSDVVSIHCDYNPSTEHLIGGTEIALMRDQSILINTARGGIADEQAVVTALNQGKLAGIAFDVLKHEPPANNKGLLSVAHLPNALITPHIAWASEQAMRYLVNTVTKNIDAFVAGRPINLVNHPK